MGELSAPSLCSRRASSPLRVTQVSSLAVSTPVPLPDLISALLGFPVGSDGEESACIAGDLGWIPGLGRSPGRRKGYPLQHSGLENSMDCTVHGVAKNRTPLSDIHFQAFPMGFGKKLNPGCYESHKQMDGEGEKEKKGFESFKSFSIFL